MHVRLITKQGPNTPVQLIHRAEISLGERRTRKTRDHHTVPPGSTHLSECYSTRSRSLSLPQALGSVTEVLPWERDKS